MTDGNTPQAPVFAHPKLSSLHEKIHRIRDFFPGQRVTEIVRLCIRNHWITDVKIYFRFLLLGLLIPLILIYLLQFSSVTEAAWHWIYFTFSIWLALIWLDTFIEFLKNELSILVITNERIVDMVQTSLFGHRMSETSLDRIQDVIGITRGVVGTFLDVGDLEVETAGRELAFLVKNVKSPQLTARKILDVQRQSGLSHPVNTSSLEEKIAKRAGDLLSDEEILNLRKQRAETHGRRREDQSTNFRK